MKTYEQLVERSLAGTLSAIEIYNKPDFRYREELFAILVINGWELLLKARILQEANDELSAIFVSEAEGGTRKTRSGADLTISLGVAMDRLSLDAKVRENLHLLVELRDAAVHFVNDQDIKYATYALGAASLQNYHHLCEEWFDRSLADYNFFILPLGFSYNFKTLAIIDAGGKHPSIASFFSAIDDACLRLPSEPGETFHLVCELRVTLVSQKKQTEDIDSVVGITSDPESATAIVVKYQAPIDKYPLSYRELEAAVRLARPGTKQSAIQRVVGESHLKGDPKYSAYSFRTQAHKKRFEEARQLPKDIAVIYNQEAVRWIVAQLG